MTIIIYHNPACGTSRNTLGLIRNSGEEPTIIEYLNTPPNKQTLLDLISAMEISVRELLRKSGTPYFELDLDNPDWKDDQLIEFLLKYPALMNRPIVVTPLGTRLCRPSEEVLEILPKSQLGAFDKEDGTAIIDQEGNRV